MRNIFLVAFLSGIAAFGNSKPARAYDIDCAIMLCMAGGFPPSAVCARAYSTMIRRIMPWPSRPPFGICTFAAVPVALGGPGGEGSVDTSLPDYEWLNRTHVIWFEGRSYKSDDEPRDWSWSVRSCDRENNACHYIHRVRGSRRPWPEAFTSQSGQVIAFPAVSIYVSHLARAIMVEYGDYDGHLGHSEWFTY